MVVEHIASRVVSVAVLAQEFSCSRIISFCRSLGIVLISSMASSKHASQFSDKLIEFIQQLLDNKDKIAPNTTSQRIIDYAIQERIARYHPGLKAQQFLVHNENRGKLMLDWYQMHENGSKIKKAGARESKVSKDCVAFELASCHRAVQIASNEQLVAQSNGHIAPVIGNETFVSVAGGHFSQFVKAAEAGCKTPIVELQDACGCLSVAVLSKDDEYFKSLCENGWEWLVFPAAALDAWPALADFLQFAFNSGTFDRSIQISHIAKIQ